MSTLDADLQAGLDPVELARRIGMTCDPWQARALRSAARQELWLASRQSGKSTTAALRALHCAVYRPGATVLLISTGQTQAQELLKKVTALYRQLGRPVASTAENQLSLQLENGSRVVSLPGDERTIRGYSAQLIVIDEAARVPDELYDAIRPMLAVTGGVLLALSTPAGKRGWYYDAWEQGGPGWERVKVTAEQCPRIKPAWLEQERKTLGEFAWRQEYGCDFVDDATQVFGADYVEAAFTSAATPLWVPEPVGVAV